MPPKKLKLDHEWDVGTRIDGGGFGEVFAACSPVHKEAAAKLVPKAEGAQRELLFVDIAGVRNVVPIIESGETADHWVLIMPRATKSLRQHLDDAGGPLDRSEAITILRDIATALADMDGKIVHRDLKPENVLYLDGHWCLADFGISRYAEATTAADTQKYAWSPPYAAPERWRGERATIAADVYALGAIGFEMLSGFRVFPGPYREDFREQHLHNDPPSLDAGPAPMRALIGECLYKAPEARPRPANFIARLERMADTRVSSGLARLQEANSAEVARRAEAVRKESVARTEAERLKALYEAGISQLSAITDELTSAIMDAAPTAHMSKSPTGGLTINMGVAQLTLTPPMRSSSHPWGGWEPPAFTLIAYTELNLCIPPDRYEYEGRAHSLWYCDAGEASAFQWFETAFMVSPLIAKRGRQNPFAMTPGEGSAKALWTGMSEFQVAWPFTPLVVGELDEFVDRWGGWFADAVQGKMRLPTRMPEKDAEGTWRRK